MSRITTITARRSAIFVPRIAAALLRLFMRRVVGKRKPDFIVGAANPDGAYLHRWFVIPRNRWLNVYLHQFLRDDDDRALHDHPWWSASLMLGGAYIEHTIDAGGIHRRELILAGALRFRGATHAHRIELVRGGFWLRQAPDAAPTPIALPCWTLFITGPRLRRWGFHCPKEGWIPWESFTAAGQPGEAGPGCDAEIPR
jgi:hypothetical protein